MHVNVAKHVMTTQMSMSDFSHETRCLCAQPSAARTVRVGWASSNYILPVDAIVISMWVVVNRDC